MATGKKWSAPKDPEAIRDYGLDWTPDIGTAVIVSSLWTVVSGSDTVVVERSSYTDTNTTVRLSGGVAGEVVSLLNHIVMDDDEEDEQTMILTIKER